MSTKRLLFSPRTFLLFSSFLPSTSLLIATHDVTAPQMGEEQGQTKQITGDNDKEAIATQPQFAPYGDKSFTAKRPKTQFTFDYVNFDMTIGGILKTDGWAAKNPIMLNDKIPDAYEYFKQTQRSKKHPESRKHTSVL